MDWRTFWNGDHAIYVDARHRAVHARIVARGLVAVLPPGTPRVLDWGCGEAEEAPTVAIHCARLYLFDAAPRVRDKLRARYAADPRIEIVDDDRLRSIADRSLDCIAIVSVVQYLGVDVLRTTLMRLHAKLAPGARLVIADVIGPDVTPLDDARALLGLARQHGFLAAALRGLARTFFSDYRRLRSTLGLTRWTETQLVALLSACGFDATRSSENIGHNQKRMTFIAARR